MSATITDYFNKASNMSGSYPAVATVTAARSTGGSTLSCDDLSSWATDTPVHFSTFKVNTDGTIDTSTQTDWKGIVNGNTITDMTRLAGAADSGNASGDRVELNPTVGWLDDLITGILVSHKQNGALKDNAVTESSIATGAVTSTKLGDGSVTSAKIGTGAISSYDKIGDDVIQARNLDFSTFNMITLKGSYGDSTASANSKISLDIVQEVIGDKLTKYDNAVKIGAGVTKVLVSASTFYASNGGAYGWCRIQKNAADTGFAAITNLTNSSYGTAAITPVILSVAEGDVIRLWNIDAAKVRGNSTFMTVVALR